MNGVVIHRHTLSFNHMELIICGTYTFVCPHEASVLLHVPTYFVFVLTLLIDDVYLCAKPKERHSERRL